MITLTLFLALLLYITSFLLVLVFSHEVLGEQLVRRDINEIIRHRELFTVTNSKAGLLKAGSSLIQSLLFGLTAEIFTHYFSDD
jgi:hypothetical protein